MLRYGCLCNANRTYWKLNKIAEALGLPLMTVSDICKRFRRENCQIQRIDLRVNNGPRFKLSREQIRTVTNIHMLQQQCTYPLDERVHDLAANFNIHISRCTLRSYYLRNGIKFQSVNLHNTNKLTRELVIRQQQIEYCRLIRQARADDRYIFYLDESSISTWNPPFKKTYSSGRVMLSYPGYRVTTDPSQAQQGETGIVITQFGATKQCLEQTHNMYLVIQINYSLMLEYLKRRSLLSWITMVLINQI